MAKQKKMKAQAAAKPITAKELKFWLEGFLEFQEEGWVPNAEQWKKIQDKIFNLDDEQTVVVQQSPQNVRSRAPNAFLPPDGGAAGLPASTFPEEGHGSSFGHASSLDIAPVRIPTPNAQGFLELQENFGFDQGHNQQTGVPMVETGNGLVKIGPGLKPSGFE